MFITVDILTSQTAPSGQVGLRLDWNSMAWNLSQDPRFVWKALCFENNGRFERNSGGEIRIWDRSRQIMNLCDAPNGNNDVFGSGGSGTLSSPVDSNFTGGSIRWGINFTACLYEPSAAPASTALSPFRQHLLRRLNQLLPAPYLSANCDILTTKMRRSDPAIAGATGNYTSCGSMPGFVSSEMGTFKGYKGKAHEAYMNKYSLNGTNSIRIKGIRHNCWKENNLTDRPVPGDVYGLLVPGGTDKKNTLFSHVGVIEDCSGNPWKTMDLGQGTGFDGKKVERDYKSDTGELYGESNQGGGYRVLAGWVDIDEYLKVG